MSEKEVKIDKVEEKGEAALFARVRKIEKKLEKVIKTLEGHFGMDLDADGKVGSIRVALMACLLIAGMTSASIAGTIWNLRNSSNTTDVVTIDNTGAIVAAGGLTGPVASSNLTANIAQARMTNAVSIATGTLITNTCVASTGQTNTYVFVPFGTRYFLHSITTSP